jgi:hypothetical protein
MLKIDSSVLENYHVSETFKVMLVPENNIMKDFTPEEFRICRRRMIDMILATDMKFHSKHISSLKAKMENLDIKYGDNIERLIIPDNLTKTYENQQSVLDFLVHTADISNSGKSYKLCVEWQKRIYEEFFIQGDFEKKEKMNVSFLCDREKTNINISQINFMKFVVIPNFEVLINLFPELNQYVDNCKTNMRKFELIVREETEKSV